MVILTSKMCKAFERGLWACVRILHHPQPWPVCLHLQKLRYNLFLLGDFFSSFHEYVSYNNISKNCPAPILGRYLAFLFKKFQHLNVVKICIFSNKRNTCILPTLCFKTLPEAQRTQGIESITQIITHDKKYFRGEMKWLQEPDLES